MHIISCFIALLRLISLSYNASDLRLLEVTSRPSASDLLARDRPDLSRRGSRAGDGARDDVDDGADRRLLLVEVSNLVHLDFEDGNAGVRRFAGVDAIALVAEPCLDGGVVQLLDEALLLDSPAVRSGAAQGVMSTHLALPAIESQPVLEDEPSMARLTWKLGLATEHGPLGGSSSLLLDLGVFVALPVVQKSEAPIGGDLGRSHHSGVQASVGSMRGEEDGVVLLDESSQVRQLLAERTLRLGLLRVLVVTGHADGCCVKGAGKSRRERESADDERCAVGDGQHPG